MSAQESIEVAVGVIDGKVILKFPSTIEYLEMDAQNAIDIGEALAAAAFELRDGVPAAGPALKAALVEKHHDVLVSRVALMLGSMREDKLKSNGDLALAVVEACLREVF